ncbi:MAG: DUF2156 domain-containing protein [Fimbriimonadaceae bacterium]
MQSRARELLLDFGENAASYQIINPNITKWLSTSGDCLIGYVTHHRVRVVAGSPVGPSGVLLDSLQRFQVEAKKSGEEVVLFGIDEAWLTHLQAFGDCYAVSLGSQPVWKPNEWEQTVLSDASLRAQFNRARNKGVVVKEWITAEATDSPELRSVLTEWLDNRGMPPLHFLVEPETLHFLDDRRTFVAEQNGEPIAFLNLCPIPQKQGWLTEQFPRRSKAPNGTVELLLDHAIQTVNSEGAQYVTMGLVPLSETAADAHNPAWLRFLAGWAQAHGRRFYNFGGLEFFKAKFHPHWWERLYAVSLDGKFTPRHLAAISSAFTEEALTLALIKGGMRAIRQEFRWLSGR